jgi:4-amino-4-deoxy-L-arabinose transferase-like glycosyltransferase
MRSIGRESGLGIKPQRLTPNPFSLSLLALFLFFTWAELAALRRESPTVDEQNHIARGLSVLATRDPRLYIGHPPLINVISALPLVFDARIQLPLDDVAWRTADWIAFAMELFWKRNNPALVMLTAARLMIVLLGVAFLAVLYRLGADVGGPWLGLGALALAALDPTLRAHSRLATTDLGVTLMLTITLWLWRRWLRRPRPRAAMLAGAALGLALVSKFTALIYVPSLALAALFTLGLNRRSVGQCALAMASAALAAWAAYGFELRPAFGLPVPVPMASYGEEFLSASVVFERYTYLLGSVTRQGSLAYFPLALAVKTPLPLLFSAALGLALWLRRAWRAEAALWFPSVVFLATAILARVNIGYRHLMPIFPLMYLGGALALIWLWRSFQWGRWVAGALIAWLALNTALVYPRDLTFFNEIAGGPDNGHRFLVDSNLDWGQDLGELVEYVRARRIDSIYVSYFGSVPIGSLPVKEYPIPARPLPPRPTSHWRRLFPAPGWYAISLNHLLGAASLDNPDTFAYFRQHQPEAILGRTIYIYYVPEERGVVAACLNPPPSLGEAEVRRTFGAALTRYVPFDCEKGLPLPTGLTWYLLRGEQEALMADALTRLGARLEFREDYPGDPKFAQTLYRLDEPTSRAAAYPAVSVAPQTFGGLASFIGYRYREPLQPGQPAQVQTIWRIESRLPESVSVFLHLTAPDGFTVEVSDGFNAPYDALYPGEALIQFHPLTYPAGLPIGSQWRVGLYRLGGAQERYRLPGGAEEFIFSP